MIGAFVLLWLAFICLAFGWGVAAVALLIGAGAWVALWSLHVVLGFFMPQPPAPRR